jgi:hypothetical protein
MGAMRNGHVWWIAAFLVGCGGSGAREAASPEAKTASGTAEDPVVTCGPQESYAYVAQYRCPDGSKPFAGDLSRAADSRAGSLPSKKNEHIIDLYEVPCASGIVPVHVDLYGCEEYERRLKLVDSPGTAQLKGAFSAGQFAEVLANCPAPEDESVPNDTRTWCLAMVPASLHALGRHPDALSRIAKVCALMPPAGPKSASRASYLAMIMMMLTDAHRAGHFESEGPERKALVDSWVDTCQVPLEQVENTVRESQQQAQ